MCSHISTVLCCRVASCGVASRRVVLSRRVASRRVASRRVASRRVVSCRVVSCRVVSCRVVSCRVVSCRVVSCRVVSVLEFPHNLIYSLISFQIRFAKNQTEYPLQHASSPGQHLCVKSSDKLLHYLMFGQTLFEVKMEMLKTHEFHSWLNLNFVTLSCDR